MSESFSGDTRTNRERMLAGELYDASDPELVSEARRAVRLADEYARIHLMDNHAARHVLVDLVGHLGEGVEIKPPLFVDYGTQLSIGERTFINYNLTALDVAPISIGADCLIGPNVQLLTPTHPLDPKQRRAKLEAAMPITIGDNVWIGGGATVLPGVSIGDNSVIGAGSVVTRDVPANVVAVGNPARVIKNL
ncbi:sugar O-acetyltransferase [Paeniglutamicibacter psychrophenolicus]|uniref:Maltose O-acetyltransferase n=1 Tax=Paeniglutamicibacter psychrophenolicus TaxID=257454 RepID=A0ABS4WFG7_9MICC|nr:sugar O-acetyltransferase [Paeniglutamicibacter psychrophenolicus]MBP2374920.1 maltose O-acetyltransferase [Paeniglutamicibacter psychrophenolicus]